VKEDCETCSLNNSSKSSKLFRESKFPRQLFLLPSFETFRGNRTYSLVPLFDFSILRFRRLLGWELRGCFLFRLRVYCLCLRLSARLFSDPHKVFPSSPSSYNHKGRLFPSVFLSIPNENFRRNIEKCIRHVPCFGGDFNNDSAVVAS
jgi:hypothetical protein